MAAVTAAQVQSIAAVSLLMELAEGAVRLARTGMAQAEDRELLTISAPGAAEAEEGHRAMMHLED